MPLDPPGLQKPVCHLTVGSSQEQVEGNKKGSGGEQRGGASSSKMVPLKLASQPSPLPWSSSGATSFLHF